MGNRRRVARPVRWAQAAADEWRGGTVAPSVDLELFNMIRQAKGLPAVDLVEATAQVQDYIDSGEHDRVMARFEQSFDGRATGPRKG